MARRTRRNIVEEIMNEPIRMPGFPQLIVTRSRAHAWLKEIGWNMDQRTPTGQSADRMVFLPAVADEPLTDDATREHYLAQMAAYELARA